MSNRNKAGGRDFGDLALGEVIEMFLVEAAFTVQELRNRVDRLEDREFQQLRELEELLADGPATGGDDLWSTAFTTGDPLTDRWEQQVVAGEIPDLDEVV